MADPEVSTTEQSQDDDAQDEPTRDQLSDEAQAGLAIFERELGDAIIEHGAASRDLVLRIKPDSWRRAAEVARDALDCDYLSFVSAIDWMPRPSAEEDAEGDTSAPVQPSEVAYGVAGSQGRYQVFARVCSTSRHWGFTLKCDVDESHPTAQSWVSVYPGADWHERECWEMYGIVFDGHPGLRNLYLPSEFEGHPLRKDFPLLAREVKPWPGLVDVEDMPEVESAEAADEASSGEEVAT